MTRHKKSDSGVGEQWLVQKMVQFLKSTWFAQASNVIHDSSTAIFKTWDFHLKTVAEILAGAVFENGAADRALRGPILKWHFRIPSVPFN